MKRFTIWFGNLNIRQKLALGFGLMVLLIVLGNLLNLVAQTNAERANRHMRDAYVQALYAEQLRANALASDRSIKEGVLAYLSRGLESAIVPFNNGDLYLKASLDTLASIRHSANNPELGPTLDALEENLTSIKSDLNTIIVPQAQMRGDEKAVLTGQLDAIVAALGETAHPALVTEIEELKIGLAEFLPDPGTVTTKLQAINTQLANITSLAAEADVPEAERADFLALVNTAQTAITSYLTKDLLMGLRISDSIEKVDATSLAASEYVALQTQKQAAAQAELDEARAAVRRIQYLINGTVIGLALLLSLIIGWNIARPLRTLTDITGQIAQGDYDRKTHITTHDEIGKLAQSIDSMVSVIKTREADLRQQTDQLRVATAQAREASRIKGEFLANMSHELRTPLNAIIGFSDILLIGMTGPLTDKQTHQITRLRENGQRLLDLVNDILDLARIEAKRVEFSPKPFAPRELIETLENQVAPLAAGKPLVFTTQVDPALPNPVMGDAKRISQVVVNLLSNAFKFTAEGHVTLRAGLSPNKTWYIAVQDSGVGIPPHALDLIFEEFRQVDGSSTRKYGGTGLGLAISRQLAHVMGGQLTVSSQLNQGSTFTLTLPLEPADLLSDVPRNAVPEATVLVQET